MAPFPQERRHVTESKLFELFQNGLRRRPTVNAMRGVLETPRRLLEALEVLRRVVSMHAESKAAMVPRVQVPRLHEPEDQAAMTMTVAEVAALEARHVAELKHEIAVAELEHEASEVTEVAWLEVPMLSNQAPVVELEAMVRPMKLRACLP